MGFTPPKDTPWKAVIGTAMAASANPAFIGSSSAVWHPAPSTAGAVPIYAPMYCYIPFGVSVSKNATDDPDQPAAKPTPAECSVCGETLESASYRECQLCGEAYHVGTACDGLTTHYSHVCADCYKLNIRDKPSNLSLSEYARWMKAHNGDSAALKPKRSRASLLQI